MSNFSPIDNYYYQEMNAPKDSAFKHTIVIHNENISSDTFGVYLRNEISGSNVVTGITTPTFEDPNTEIAIQFTKAQMNALTTNSIYLVFFNETAETMDIVIKLNLK